MKLHPIIFAASLILPGNMTACGAASQAPETDSQVIPTLPTVMISPVKKATTSPEMRPTRRIFRIIAETKDPVLTLQQHLWDCVIQADAFLFMECMDEIASGAECYNVGLNKIVDSNKQLRACQEAAASRTQGGEQYEIAEHQCIQEVLHNKPHKLRPLDHCLAPQISCLRDLIKNSSIVCTVEDEDALFAK